MAASTHLPPRVASPLRGPGQWVRLEPDVAFDAELDPAPVRGRFFDVGTVPGFVLFLSLLGGFVAAAITILRTSTYLGLWVALASSVLFPIFCTGRAGDLPPDPAISPRALLDWLSSVLAKDASIEAHPIGRVPLGGKTHDELRLLVMPKKPLTGLVAVEVGVDFHQGALGPLPLPFVIVRVVEGSTAAAALPVGLFWSRGRAADERVAVLRPRLPTRRLTARLTLDLVASLSATKSAFRGQKAAPTSASRSGGKAQSTAKPGTTSSPVHAT